MLELSLPECVLVLNFARSVTRLPTGIGSALPAGIGSDCLPGIGSACLPEIGSACPPGIGGILGFVCSACILELFALVVCLDAYVNLIFVFTFAYFVY